MTYKSQYIGQLSTWITARSSILIFSAIGKPFKGIMLSLSRQVIFLIPLMLILPVFLGIDGIMLAAPVADTIAFVFSIVMIKKEFSKMRLPGESMA